METDQLLNIFSQRFGAPASLYAAPGRINLIGEHTDYNGGFVFPGAIKQGILTAIRPNGSRSIHAYATDLDDYTAFSIDDPDGPTQMHFRYLFGVVREMMEMGVKVEGFDAIFTGDVPLGAGMSSSAALESCFVYAINDLFGGKLDRMTMARIGQATEHKYIGVQCGIMDQFASMYGRSGQLLRLDCRNGNFEYFPWNPKGYKLVLVNSCVKHELVGSPYNDRRKSCERVVAEIGKFKKSVETLRDCTWDDLVKVKNLISADDYRRAYYVLGEVDRVIEVCDALNSGDYERVGKQMYKTHEGLSRDYEVSCSETDFLVDMARKCGVSGSRIMGGGFGGCTINLVKNSLYPTFLTEVKAQYNTHFNVDCQIIEVEIGDGARKIK